MLICIKNIQRYGWEPMTDSLDDFGKMLKEIVRKNYDRLKREPPVFEGLRTINVEPKWLAFFLDVSRGQVSHWLTGRRRIPSHMLFVMTHLLRVLLDILEEAYRDADLTEEERDRATAKFEHAKCCMGLQMGMLMTIPETESTKDKEKAHRYWTEHVLNQDKEIPEDLKTSPGHVIPPRRNGTAWTFDSLAGLSEQAFRASWAKERDATNRAAMNEF